MSERKVAIVTGSATGVGAATALALSSLGYDVVINYTKSEAQARQTEAACRDAGAQTLLVPGDVAQDADCRRLVHEALGRWGRLDALINNAGVTAFAGAQNWDAVDASTFQRVVGVNAMGTFQMIRACAAHLKATRGSVVNVSSIAGSLGVGSSVAYIASKGAINSMTLYFARVLAPEVRVNAVCPGLITTRWFTQGIGQDGYERIKAGYENATPLGRACTAEDVAEAVAWLTRGASTITGELLLMDAGLHLGKAPSDRPASGA